MIRNHNLKYFNSYKEQIEDAKKVKGLPLYRFFPEEWQAQCFMEGKIWLSTLERCRSYEDEQQGDRNEGSSKYTLNLNTTNRFINEEDVIAAAHAGIMIGDMCFNFQINNSQVTNVIRDGFILCTTNDPDSLIKKNNIWKYGVKIDLEPRKLAYFLTNAILRENIPISTPFKHGWTKYGDFRNYSNYKDKPSNTAFLKDEIHKEQSEYRFFVEANDSYIYPNEGILIDCPEIIKYLEKINI